MVRGLRATDKREHLERFRGVTLQTLEWVPDGKLHFAPQEGLRPFDEQFLHIARTEEYHVRGLLLGDRNRERYFARPDALTKDTLRRVLDETRAAAANPLENSTT